MSNTDIRMSRDDWQKYRKAERKRNRDAAIDAYAHGAGYELQLAKSYEVPASHLADFFMRQANRLSLQRWLDEIGGGE